MTLPPIPRHRRRGGPPARLRPGSTGAGAGAGGFSLLQLLVYAVASGLTLTAASAALVSSIRSNANLELYQRVEERWGRLSYLIQSETTEARQVLYGQPLTCTGVTGTSTFTLRVPYISETGGVQTEAMAVIHYYERGTGADTELRRCGPPYLANGQLDFSTTPRDSSIGLMTDLTVSSPTTDSFAFTMDLYTPSNQRVMSRTSSANVGVEPIDPG